jgi:hypothetical protein
MSLGELGISQGNMLKCYEHIFVFVTMVGVLLLVYMLVLQPAGYGLDISLAQKRAAALQGFQNYSAGNIGYYSDRTDAPGDASQPNPYASTAAQAVQGFSNSAYEPPVYWPAGSLGMINAYGQANIGAEGDDMNAADAATVVAAAAASGGPDAAAKVASGFRNKLGNYSLGSLQGFRNRSGMQSVLDKSLQGY